MLKEEDLIEGKAYHGYFKDYFKDGYYMIVGRSKGSNYKNETPYIRNNCFAKGSLEHPRFIITHEGTSLETKWINECIKQNKFIPKDQIKVDEIINDYQII